jgi:hypothetical protein
MILPLCLVLSALSIVSGQRYVISTDLPNIAHGVDGQLYIERAGDAYSFVLENFRYDGGGPDTVIYVYFRGQPVQSSGGGTVIPLSPSQEAFTLGRPYNGATLSIAIPSNIDVRNIATFTIWCRRFPSFFTRADIPEGIFDATVAPTEPPITPPAVYDNCEPLGKNLQVSWTMNTTSDMVFVKLCGCINSVEYMAFGISGSNSFSRMLNADVVVTWLSDSSAGAVDYYLTDYSQCRPGVEGGQRGACPDSVQGGNNNATVLRGRLEGNSRCVEYFRPISATEAQDREMNGDLYVVWGIGPRDTNTNFAFKHFERLINDTRITFNRNAANNCPAQTCPAGEVCPWAEEVIDARNRDATFVARIGQSGATRGYFGITGMSGWGITWYINDLIIPVLRVTRGNKYTFQIYGGQDEEDKANYHPFYLTNSVQGGRLANNASMQASEKVYAGFSGNTPTAVGELCMYEDSIPQSSMIRENCSTDFGDYFRSLVEKEPCSGKNPGFLEWTPDDNTPDLLYYQCATHLNLGWKIQVDSKGFSAAPFASFLFIVSLLIIYINL